MYRKWILFLLLWICTRGLPLDEEQLASLTQLEHYLDEIQGSLRPEDTVGTKISASQESGEPGQGEQIVSKKLVQSHSNLPGTSNTVVQHKREDKSSNNSSNPELSSPKSDEELKGLRLHNDEQELKNEIKGLQKKLEKVHASKQEHKSAEHEHQNEKLKGIGRLQDDKDVLTKMHASKQGQNENLQMNSEEIGRLHKNLLKQMHASKQGHNSAEHEHQIEKLQMKSQGIERLQNHEDMPNRMHASKQGHYSAENEHQLKAKLKMKVDEIRRLQDVHRRMQGLKQGHNSDAKGHQFNGNLRMESEEIERLQDHGDMLNRMHASKQGQYSAEHEHKLNKQLKIKSEEIRRLQDVIERMQASKQRHNSAEHEKQLQMKTNLNKENIGTEPSEPANAPMFTEEEPAPERPQAPTQQEHSEKEMIRLQNELQRKNAMKQAHPPDNTLQRPQAKIKREHADREKHNSGDQTIDDQTERLQDEKARLYSLGLRHGDERETRLNDPLYAQIRKLKSELKRKDESKEEKHPPEEAHSAEPQNPVPANNVVRLQSDIQKNNALKHEYKFKDKISKTMKKLYESNKEEADDGFHLDNNDARLKDTVKTEHFSTDYARKQKLNLAQIRRLKAELKRKKASIKRLKSAKHKNKLKNEFQAHNGHAEPEVAGQLKSTVNRRPGVRSTDAKTEDNSTNTPAPVVENYMNQTIDSLHGNNRSLADITRDADVKAKAILDKEDLFEYYNRINNINTDKGKDDDAGTETDYFEVNSDDDEDDDYGSDDEEEDDEDDDDDDE